MSRVLVERLSAEDSQRDVEEEFRVYGAIRSVQLPALMMPGYAVVEFDDRRDALNAVAGTLAGNSGRYVRLQDDSQVGCRRRGGCLNGRRVACLRGGDEEPTKFKESDAELAECVTEVVLGTVCRFYCMDMILRDWDVGQSKIEKSVAEVVLRNVKRFDSMDNIRKGFSDGDTEFKKSVAQVVTRSLELYMRGKKILKEFAPIELEESVAQALFDLEHTNDGDLKDLYIDSATQVNVSANCNAILICYPYELVEGFRKIHVKLVGELEKKFTGSVVVLIGTGRRLPNPPLSYPFLWDNVLSDIVYPTEMLGWRPRKNLGLLSCWLDPKARKDTVHKLDAFAAVFRKLCWMNVEFNYA